MRVTGRKFLFLAVLFLLVLGFVVVRLWRPTAGYKVVLLTDQMSYFGKIRNLNDDFAVLTDVFYVRAKATGGKENPPAAAGFELVKLGGELHGPEDSIILNRKRIISIQDLKDDSPVVRAIREYYLTREKSG